MSLQAATSAVNYGGCTRGDLSGCDEWARLVGEVVGCTRDFCRSSSERRPGRLQGENSSMVIKVIHPAFVNHGYPLTEHVKQAMIATGIRWPSKSIPRQHNFALRTTTSIAFSARRTRYTLYNERAYYLRRYLLVVML